MRVMVGFRLEENFITVALDEMRMEIKQEKIRRRVRD